MLHRGKTQVNANCHAAVSRHCRGALQRRIAPLEQHVAARAPSSWHNVLSPGSAALQLPFCQDACAVPLIDVSIRKLERNVPGMPCCRFHRCAQATDVHSCEPISSTLVMCWNARTPTRRCPVAHGGASSCVVLGGVAMNPWSPTD